MGKNQVTSQDFRQANKRKEVIKQSSMGPSVSDNIQFSGDSGPALTCHSSSLNADQRRWLLTHAWSCQSHVSLTHRFMHWKTKQWEHSLRLAYRCLSLSLCIWLSCRQISDFACAKVFNYSTETFEQDVGYLYMEEFCSICTLSKLGSYHSVSGGDCWSSFQMFWVTEH